MATIWKVYSDSVTFKTKNMKYRFYFSRLHESCVTNCKKVGVTRMTRLSMSALRWQTYNQVPSLPLAHLNPLAPTIEGFVSPLFSPIPSLVKGGSARQIVVIIHITLFSKLTKIKLVHAQFYSLAITLNNTHTHARTQMLRSDMSN